MDGQGDRKIRVGGFEYTIDVPDNGDIATIVASIKAALDNGTVVVVAVLDEQRNPMDLYINGGQVGALVIDVNKGPRPGELAP